MKNFLLHRLEIIAISFTVILVTTVLYPQIYAAPDYSKLVDNVSNTVVNIAIYEKAKKVTMNKTNTDFLKKFGIPIPDDNTEKDHDDLKQKGVGSGFIISRDGYILTNAHVVKSAEVIKVKMSDETEYDATLIGLDEKTDVAVLKIDVDNIAIVMIGDSSKIKSGEWVMAMGSPHGLEKTVTAGIISSTKREIGEFMQFIQTDVAINPGNSGGPLFNKYGQVIGINSMILSKSGGYQGIALSIPINDALSISEKLIKDGKIERSQIGIMVSKLNSQRAKKMDLDLKEGVVVEEVKNDGPAAKAGLQANDIIIKFNDVLIKQPIDLMRKIGDSKPGDTINLTIIRSKEIKNIVVITEKQPDIKPDKS